MIELIFAILGLMMLITGKISQSVFQTLFGKGIYAPSAKQARLFGLLLISCAPLVIMCIAVMTVIFNDEAEEYVFISEVIVLALVAFIALKWARSFRQPEPTASEPAPIVPTEEPATDVFTLSDHEIRQKLGLEPPEIPETPPPPAPDPAAQARWRAKRWGIMIIGFMAGILGPLLMLVVSFSTGGLTGISRSDRIMVYAIIGVALVMGTFFTVFFAVRSRKK